MNNTTPATPNNNITNNKLFPFLVILLITFILVGAFIVIQYQQTSYNSKSDSSSVGVNSTSQNKLVANNGLITYTKELQFQVPRRNTNTLILNINIQDNKITNLVADVITADEKSLEYKQTFLNEINKEVTGKKIQDLDLSSVGGASLTTEAFMKIINEIK